MAEEEDGAEIRRRAARLMASAKTAAQRESFQRIARLGREVQAARAAPCTCGREAGYHRSSCPVYHRLGERRARKARIESERQSDP